MSAEVEDPLVDGLRAQIAALDVEIVHLVNRRLGLVSALWAHKRENEQPLRSPEREDWLLRHLLASNGGPLSEDGVRRLQELLLDLTRSELA
ncbi:MAG: chorismate mutase [Gaiellaceae bacterium]